MPKKTSTKTAMKKNETYEIGDTIAVPLHLSAGTLTVNCVVVDKRTVYGRSDIQVSPVDGEGAAWVRLDRIEDGTGPTADRSKGWQAGHNEWGTKGSGTQVPDEEANE